MIKYLKKIISDYSANLRYQKEDYNDKYYSDMDCGVQNNPVAEIFIADLQKSIEGEEALSIGCGTGIFEYKIMSLRKSLRIVGTEFVETETQRKLWESYGIQVIIADATQQPFSDDSFDTVYSHHVLEHVPRPYEVIKESIRVTRKLALHMVPINLNNPDHIHFFKFGALDNEYRTQPATIDLEKVANDIISEYKGSFPDICYELELSCPRDGSVDYGEMEFSTKKEDRPDGLMPTFVLKFYKYGKQS